MGRGKVNYPEAVGMLAAGASYDTVAAHFGVKPDGLRVSMSRKGVTKTLAKHKKELRLVTQKAERNALQEISRRVRGLLADEVTEQVESLRSSPVRSPKELGNTPDGEGRTTIAKKLIDGSALLFDWDSDKAAGIILAVDLRQGMLTGPNAVVDVPSLPQDEPGEVELIADTLPAAEPDPPSTQSG